MKPVKPGDIAYCRQGHLGLITDKNADVCKGIHLSGEKKFGPWQSIKPEVVGNIFDLLIREKVS